MKRFVDNKYNIFLLFSSPLCLTSTFFFFGPIQLYLSNITELWFSFTDVLYATIPAFILVTVLVTFSEILIYSFSPKIFYIYAALLCGLGIAFYIQGNYIPFKYGILNGDTVVWENYGELLWFSTAIWLACLIISIASVFLFKLSHKVLAYISAGIILVQCVALVGTIFVTDFSQSAISDSYISNEGIYEVSEKQNVFTFVLDSFDDEYLKELYNNDPKSLDFLDGFTFFTNMGGSYPNTRAALPYILTGQNYKNEQPYTEYVEQAWEKGAGYYQELLNQEFEINIYADTNEMISEKAKESFIFNVVHEKVHPSGLFQLETSILRFTSMRFFPDALKKYIWEYDDLFEDLKVASQGNAEPVTWDGDVFFQGLQNEGLTLVDEKKYSVIYLDGTHTPFTYLEDYSQNPSKATAMTEARANLNMLHEFIDQLKELKVYDQTCIIVTSDHGKIGHLRNPILLIKKFNGNGELSVLDNPVSHKNLFSTVLSELGITNSTEYGTSAFSSDTNSTERFFYHYTILDSYDKKYLPNMTEYIIEPQGNAERNFVATGNVFTENGIFYYAPYEYNIGDIIYFDNIKSKMCFTAGISDIEKEGTIDYIWSEGYDGQLRLNISKNDQKKDYFCHISLHKWMLKNAQHVIVKSNGTVLYDAIVTVYQPFINFAIPQDCVKNNCITLDFEYPDACSPASLKLGPDDRILAIAFKSLLLEEQKEANDISFLTDGNANDYFYEGWNRLGENGGSWTNGSASIITVLPDSNSNQEIKITYKTNPAAGNTQVYYNGAFIGSLPHCDEFSTEKLTLPKQFRSDSTAQILTFVTDDATTYGGLIYEDTRILGIHVSKINFTKSS